MQWLVAVFLMISIKTTELGVQGLYLASQRNGVEFLALPFMACRLTKACFEGNALFYLPHKCMRLHDNSHSHNLTSDSGKQLRSSKSSFFTGEATGRL